MSKAEAAAADFSRAHAAYVHGTSDPGPLKAAAEAHLAAARPLEEAVADYTALTDAEAAGEDYDAARYIELGQEAGLTRMATEITRGNMPGLPPAVGGGAVAAKPEGA